MREDGLASGGGWRREEAKVEESGRKMWRRRVEGEDVEVEGGDVEEKDVEVEVDG